MGSVRRLARGGSVVLAVRPSLSVLVRPTAALLATIAAMVAASALDDSDFLVLAASPVVLAALGWFVVRYLRWAAARVLLTEDLLVSRSGVVRRHALEVPLDRIQAVGVTQSLAQRVWRSGDLRVDSGSGGHHRFTDVPRPDALRLELYRQQSRLRSI